MERKSYTTNGCVDLFEFINQPRPWYFHLYSRIKHFDFVYQLRKIKWFIQRGRRGWSDRDLWSLDIYLSSWLPGALEKLRESKHGTPLSVFPTGKGMVDETGNPTETAMQLAAAKWDRILTAMIEGFRAYYRIHNTLYDEELGPFSICRPPGVSRVAWDTLVERRFQKQTKLSKRDSRLAQRGLQLFVEHFGDLWD